MFSKFSRLIFKNTSIFGGPGKELDGGSGSWRDKSLCFDLRASDLQLDKGEILIANFFPIEDVKGNQEEMGLLMVTNLRLVWVCCHKRRVNISIGWRTVTIAFEQRLKDPLGGYVPGMCVLSKYETTKYEFVFSKMAAYNNLLDAQSWMDSDLLVELEKFASERSFQVTQLTPMYLVDPFEVVLNVWYSYKQTQLYRNCKANISNLMTAGDEGQRTSPLASDFNKLPGEETIDIYLNIQLVESKTMKYSGTLILTNIRIVWVDGVLFMKNLSIPYIRVDSIKFKQSERILIHTIDYMATSNLIELRKLSINSSSIDQSIDKPIKVIFDQMQNLTSLYKSSPKYGPEFCDECINYMGHLRPVDAFYSKFETNLKDVVQNFGPQSDKYFIIGSDGEAKQSMKMDNQSSRRYSNNNLDPDPVDSTETELNRYSQKLANYLNDQLISGNREIFYSEELGLSFEKPEHDLDLDRIWSIDVANVGQ